MYLSPIPNPCRDRCIHICYSWQAFPRSHLLVKLPRQFVFSGFSRMTYLVKAAPTMRRLVTCQFKSFPKGVSNARGMWAVYTTPTRTLSSWQPSEENEKKTPNYVFSRRLLTSAFNCWTKIVKTSYAGLTDKYSEIANSRYGRLMRLDKPVGTHLLYLPCAWSISLTATSVPQWAHLMTLFYAGSVLLRGAGCTINDIWDMDVDREVERTRNRPVASGAISVPSAFMFLGAQLGGGLVVLSQLNTESFLLAALSVFPVMIYPFAKRFTKYPQAVLGLTINAGALLGSTAAVGVIKPECALFYLGGWCWTMIYDTIYAHQDKKDDKRIGVLSTALSFKNRSSTVLTICFGACGSLFYHAGAMADLSWPYFVSLGAAGLHIAKALVQTDLNDPKSCSSTFKNSAAAGAFLPFGIILGRLL